MSVQIILLLLLLGAVAGYISGLVGIGGGVILVPALVLLLGYSQHRAQGTTLALLIPPIGLLAVWEYYRQGYVDVKTAVVVCIGFVLGGYLGGRLAVGLSELMLKRIFALTLLVLGSYLLWHSRKP